MAAKDASPSTGVKNVAAARRVNKLLEVVADQALRDSLDYVDDMYAGAATPRTNLRSDLDARLAALHDDFIERFAAVDAAFDSVSTNINSLANSAESAQRELRAVSASSRSLLATADLLNAELEDAKRRESQVAEFMQQFQLSREETDALREDVNPRFIAVLRKVQHIHASCRQIMMADQQQAAIEIQEAMYLTQLSAVERLTKHLRLTVGDAFSADSPEVTDFLVSAVATLRPHPAQWIKVMQDVAKVRRTAVLRRFLNVLSPAALATSGRGRSSSTDVVRLAGDLCAWVHQAIAEDSDALTPFFVGADNSAMTKTDVLDQIFEGICRQLKQAVEQALQECGCIGPNQNRERVDGGPVLVLFKLESVLNFYLGTTEALLGQSAALSETMREMRLDALRNFFELLQAITQRCHVAASHAVSSDLALPSEPTALLRLLKAMMDHLQASFVPHQQREADFAAVLGAVVDPLCSLADAATLPHSVAADQQDAARDVLRINVLCSVMSVVLPYDFTTAKQAKLSAQLEDVIAAFTTKTAEALRRRLGIQDKLDHFEAGSAPSLDALQETLQGFYAYVYNMGALTIPQLDAVQALRMRDRIRIEVTSNVCDSYERLHTAIAAQLGDAAKQVLFHTPEQIRVLLDVAS